MWMRYYYGMRLRGYAPMCQPKDGLVDVLPETECGGRYYHNVLCYKRMLTDEELSDYELDYLYFD